MKMTPRERVLATINHQTPDAIVTELGSTNCTSIAVKTYDQVKKLLGFQAKNQLMMEDFQISLVDEEVLEFLGTDTRGVPAHECFPKTVINEREFINHFGIHFKMPSNDLYFDMVYHPLQNMTELAEIKDYVWPDPIAPGAVAGCRERAKKLKEENRYAIVGDIVDSGIFEPAHYLRGFQNFLTDMLADDEITHYLMEQMLQFQCARQDQYLREVGEYLDIVFVGDDLAALQSPLMSPSLYRELIKPYQKRYFDFIKNRTNAKLMYHSCGNVVPLIPDLIEIGVDILNPIQVNANQMDTKYLKETFGNQICFCGAIDTNQIMPHGSIDQVRDEVKRRIEDLGPEGYILTAVHDIQADVPAQNVVAMYRAAKEFTF